MDAAHRLVNWWTMLAASGESGRTAESAEEEKTMTSGQAEMRRSGEGLVLEEGEIASEGEREDTTASRAGVTHSSSLSSASSLSSPSLPPSLSSSPPPLVSGLLWWSLPRAFSAHVLPRLFCAVPVDVLRSAIEEWLWRESPELLFPPSPVADDIFMNYLRSSCGTALKALSSFLETLLRNPAEIRGRLPLLNSRVRMLRGFWLLISYADDDPLADVAARCSSAIFPWLFSTKEKPVVLSWVAHVTPRSVEGWLAMSGACRRAELLTKTLTETLRS